MRTSSLFISVFCLCLAPAAASSADGPSDEELARKAQDPLADVRAIMTDNTIGFGTADDDTAYGFQIQPVYSIPTDRGYNLIARAVIPIVGAPVGASLPRLGGGSRSATMGRDGVSAIRSSSSSGHPARRPGSSGASAPRCLCAPAPPTAWAGRDGAAGSLAWSSAASGSSPTAAS